MIVKCVGVAALYCDIHKKAKVQDGVLWLAYMYWHGGMHQLWGLSLQLLGGFVRGRYRFVTRFRRIIRESCAVDRLGKGAKEPWTLLCMYVDKVQKKEKSQQRRSPK